MGMEGCRRMDKTEMKQGMWVYMVAGGGGWVKINKSDSLYLSA